MTKPFLLIIGLTGLLACSHGQSNSTQGTSTQAQVVGGSCEGCEAIYEYGNKTLSPTDTLPDFYEPGTKLNVRGTIYKKNGTTPAGGVILYIYHTDQGGIYPKKGGETGWAKRHGYLRGWIKTDDSGQYEFFTRRPGAYPGRNAPEHIHVTVKEPAVNEYYIEDFLFDDDSLLTENYQKNLPKRGGSGIVRLTNKGDLLVMQRDIVLGWNIPDYE